MHRIRFALLSLMALLTLAASTGCDENIIATSARTSTVNFVTSVVSGALNASLGG